MAYEKKNPDKGKIVGGIKGNVLLIGPTGVGKTYMIKLIADKLGVPFVKGDATKFTETGYVGGDVEDLVRDLVREANGDIAIAEYGIIYLDEVDKIASSTNHFGPDVSRSGVQRNLLKIMEDSDVDLKNPLDIASQMEAAMQAQKTGKIERKKINTKNILFVMSGAFQGLIDIIKKRLNTQQIGFIQDEKTKKNDELNWLKYVAKQDLIEFGFESEFVGRLPILAILDDLDVDGLYQILLNPNSSVILGKKRDFHAYGIDTEFEDKALKKIAEASHKEKTGARGLVSVLEKILIKFEKFLPSTSIKKLVINEELLDNPDIVLEKLLIQDAINRIIDEYIEKHGITLTFTDNAKDSIKLKSKENKLTPYDYCHKILTNYEYGLKLIGLSQFEVTDDVVNNYDHFLDDLIKNRSYSSVKQNKKV
ncbi:MAG: AAA family ATPase [Spirochaetota bacterium]|nr:AAA family ATPase [Spirochaetota bacterium]